MSLEKGISRVGHLIGIVAGLIGALPGIGGLIDGKIIFGISAIIIGFLVAWGLVRLIAIGIIWIVRGFKDK